jgi:hypothetical protein
LQLPEPEIIQNKEIPWSHMQEYILKALKREFSTTAYPERVG